MKNTFLTFITCSIFSFGIAQTEKNVGDFTKVTAFDKIDVNLVASTENKVVLKGANSQEVELVNKNGELKIRMPLTKMLSGDDVSATVYFKKIDAVEANEGSRIASKDEISAINFDIICKEGSEIKLTNLQADRLQIRVSQGSIVTTKGVVKNQNNTNDLLYRSYARQAPAGQFPTPSEKEIQRKRDANTQTAATNGRERIRKTGRSLGSVQGYNYQI